MRFTTPRLIVRPFEPADTPAVIPFWGDAGTMRFLGNGEPWVADEPSAAACIDRTRAYYREHPGYGFFAVELKAHGFLAGHIALKPLEADEVEVGWLVDSRFRGQGIASETARAMLRHGFETWGLEQIVAVMVPENVPFACEAESLGESFGEIPDGEPTGLAPEPHHSRRATARIPGCVDICQIAFDLADLIGRHNPAEQPHRG